LDLGNGENITIPINNIEKKKIGSSKLELLMDKNNPFVVKEPNGAYFTYTIKQNLLFNSNLKNNDFYHDVCHFFVQYISSAFTDLIKSTKQFDEKFDNFENIKEELREVKRDLKSKSNEVITLTKLIVSKDGLILDLRNLKEKLSIDNMNEKEKNNVLETQVESLNKIIGEVFYCYYY
jgi:hypothetical protein